MNSARKDIFRVPTKQTSSLNKKEETEHAQCSRQREALVSSANGRQVSWARTGPNADSDAR